METKEELVARRTRQITELITDYSRVKGYDTRIENLSPLPNACLQVHTVDRKAHKCGRENHGRGFYTYRQRNRYFRRVPHQHAVAQPLRQHPRRLYLRRMERRNQKTT